MGSWESDFGGKHVKQLFLRCWMIHEASADQRQREKQRRSRWQHVVPWKRDQWAACTALRLRVRARGSWCNNSVTAASESGNPE